MLLGRLGGVNLTTTKAHVWSPLVTSGLETEWSILGGKDKKKSEEKGSREAHDANKQTT